MLLYEIRRHILVSVRCTLQWYPEWDDRQHESAVSRYPLIVSVLVHQ